MTTRRWMVAVSVAACAWLVFEMFRGEGAATFVFYVLLAMIPCGAPLAVLLFIATLVVPKDLPPRDPTPPARPENTAAKIRMPARPPRFSLRTLMAGVAVAGLAFAFETLLFREAVDFVRSGSNEEPATTEAVTVWCLLNVLAALVIGPLVVVRSLGPWSRARGRAPLERSVCDP